MNTLTIDQSLTYNPDADAIALKKVIDISVSIADISASLQSGSLSIAELKTNATQQKMVLVVDGNESSSIGNIYYTPVYTEKLNYSEWKVRCNKTFNELGTL